MAEQFIRLVHDLIRSVSSHPAAKRVVRGAFWVFTGSCISQTLTLGASVVVARWLGLEQYGRLGAIQSTVGALGIFAGLGLGLTATKYVSEFREERPERATRVASMCLAVSVAAGLLVTVVILISADFIASGSLSDRQLGTYLRIASVLVLFNSVAGAQSGILAGLEAFRDIARTNILKGIASVPLLILGVVYAGLSGAVVALVVTAVLAVLWNHLALNKYRLLRFRSVLSERRILWRFSAPAFLGGAIVAPVMWLGTVILLRTHDGYAQLGLFSAANQWRAAVTFLPAIVAQATLPILSQAYGKGNNRHFYKLLGLNMMFTISVSTLSAIAVLVGKPFILRAYGRGYESVSNVMILMLITTVIISVGCVIGQALASAAEMWAGFWLNCAWALVFLGCCVGFVPSGGAVGLAKAFLVSYLVHGTILTGYSWFTLRTAKAHHQDALALTA